MNQVRYYCNAALLSVLTLTLYSCDQRIINVEGDAAGLEILPRSGASAVPVLAKNIADEKAAAFAIADYAESYNLS